MADNFSAKEQALGYIYQTRFALYQILQLPEENAVLIERDDDIEFIEINNKKTLASLKHKAVGDRLTNLSKDFWKSVRIWLERYISNDRIDSNLQFFLFTTGEVQNTSYLSNFVDPKRIDHELIKTIEETISKSDTTLVQSIIDTLSLLNEKEKFDFFNRIIIIDNNPRIENLPNLIIDQHMRVIRREFRQPIFERLEGWWNEIVINLLIKAREKEVFGYEVSDKLSSISDQFKIDNLPIDFRGKRPSEEVDLYSDSRLFVIQLREIGISFDRIQNAIYDYYRAVEQRSLWARENLLIEGEVSEYETLLVEEWSRYKDIVFEELDTTAAEDTLKEAGRELYKWAELSTGHLKIRERVSEPYVVRGSYHILANNHPNPKVYWHPFFMKRLENILESISI